MFPWLLAYLRALRSLLSTRHIITNVTTPSTATRAKPTDITASAMPSSIFSRTMNATTIATTVVTISQVVTRVRSLLMLYANTFCTRSIPSATTSRPPPPGMRITGARLVSAASGDELAVVQESASSTDEIIPAVDGSSRAIWRT